MDIRLDKKVAIVTGAASSIGLGCAELLARSGARVALVDYNSETLDQATKMVEKLGAVASYQLDITDVPRIAPLVSRIRHDLGEIDILVCSAGINIREPAHEVTEKSWDAINDVNIKGLFFCNQAVAVQSMIPCKRGSIINIASIMGLVGAPQRAVYCATKGAVVQATKAEAVDWAPYTIRVNAVAPAYVLTNLTKPFLDNPVSREYVISNTPMHRMVEIGEVAAAVCFLASDEAGMITGAVFTVDGGWTAQ